MLWGQVTARGPGGHSLPVTALPALPGAVSRDPLAGTELRDERALLRSALSLQLPQAAVPNSTLEFLKTNKALNVVMTALSCGWLGRISVSEAGSAENSRWKCAELLALQAAAQVKPRAQSSWQDGEALRSCFN